MKIGKLGVWASTEAMTAGEVAAFAKRVEAWGYGALWLPEAVGRNVLVHSSWLLSNTTSLVIATGIANIYARDAAAMAAAQLTLAEQSGGRFLLGVGVSHAPLVEGVRGHVYESRSVRCAVIWRIWRRRITSRRGLRKSRQRSSPRSAPR